MSVVKPRIVVASPCPSRRLALERLVMDQLQHRAREALQRHLESCPGCQGYREWLWAHDGQVKALFERPVGNVQLSEARRRLETLVSDMSASQAASALTKLAEWYFARREDADPTVYLLREPPSKPRLRELAKEAFERWRESPWGKNPRASKDRTERLELILDPSLDTEKRSACRLAVDLALEIDARCYRALVVRTRLVREAGWVESTVFENDCEILQASDEPAVQAEGLSLVGTRLSMLDGDVVAATLSCERAAQVRPGEPDYEFNAGLLRLVAGDGKASKRHFEATLAHFAGSERLKAQRQRRMAAYAAALQRAFDEGFLRRAAYRGALRLLPFGAGSGEQLA
ncbi:MAG: hypothetical protein AB1486_25945 [Planctomycetota bacterium]